MKKFFINFVILSIFIINKIYASDGKLMSNIQVNYQLALFVESMKPLLPQQLDAVTTAIDVKSFGVRGIEYFYKLNMTKEQMLKIPMFKSMAKNDKIKFYCTNQGLYWYREEFVEMKWTYLDKNDEHYLSIRGNPNDC